MILDRIMDVDKDYVKIWAEAYATLVQAETQEKMTEFATNHCPECGEHLEEDDFPEDVR